MAVNQPISDEGRRWARSHVRTLLEAAFDANLVPEVGPGLIAQTMTDVVNTGGHLEPGERGASLVYELVWATAAAVCMVQETEGITTEAALDLIMQVIEK
jgi:hypothetical protein